MEAWVSGWKPTVLKTVYPQGYVGSNPTASAKFRMLTANLKLFLKKSKNSILFNFTLSAQGAGEIYKLFIGRLPFTAGIVTQGKDQISDNGKDRYLYRGPISYSWHFIFDKL